MNDPFERHDCAKNMREMYETLTSKSGEQRAMTLLQPVIGRQYQHLAQLLNMFAAPERCFLRVPSPTVNGLRTGTAPTQ